VTATTPVHRDAGETETAAARRASKFAATLEGRVLAAVVAAGDQGLTAKEAREALGLPVERHYSVAPRLSALKRKNLVEPTGESREHFMAYRAAS
jgi:sugar-specific transcriptional regulator TrmB